MLSSMCPTILSDINTNQPFMVVGGAGGTKITTAVFQNIIKKIAFNYSLGHSVSDPRIHHQLLPMEFAYQPGFDENIIKGMENFGHITKEYSYDSSSAPVLYLNGDDVVEA